MKKPTKRQVEAADQEIVAEDEAARQLLVLDTAKNLIAATAKSRRSRLPSEHPDHICGLACDGQDGQNSYCARLRRKLFEDRS